MTQADAARRAANVAEYHRPRSAFNPGKLKGPIALGGVLAAIVMIRSLIFLVVTLAKAVAPP